jgi:hypothetical protein
MEIPKYDTRYFRGYYVFGERNYKVGDLVISVMPIELAFDGFVVKPGDVGLVIRLMQYNDWLTGEYDYHVLIQGREIFFFDHELKPHKPPRDTS